MPGAEARSPAGSRSYSQVQVLLSGRRGGAAPTAGVGRRLTLSAGCMDPRQRGTGWVWGGSPCPLGGRHLEGRRGKLGIEGALTSVPQGTLRGLPGRGKGCVCLMLTQWRLPSHLQAGVRAKGHPSPHQGFPPSTVPRGRGGGRQRWAEGPGLSPETGHSAGAREPWGLPLRAGDPQAHSQGPRAGGGQKDLGSKMFKHQRLFPNGLEMGGRG